MRFVNDSFLWLLVFDKECLPESAWFVQEHSGWWPDIVPFLNPGRLQQTPFIIKLQSSIIPSIIMLFQNHTSSLKCLGHFKKRKNKKRFSLCNFNVLLLISRGVMYKPDPPNLCQWVSMPLNSKCQHFSGTTCTYSVMLHTAFHNERYKLSELLALCRVPSFLSI